jgi:hypothetical protein
MKEKNPWIFVSIFPNLSFRDKIETKYAMIVSEQDERLKYLQSKNEAVESLTKCFIDTRLKEYKPTFLLIHNKLKTNRERHNAVVSFRNIVALSIILDGWLNMILSDNGNVFTTLYSDYYDLFPLSGYADKYFFIQTPAVSNTVSNFITKYQRNYSLPDTHHFHLNKDDDMFNSLINVWEDYFIRRNKIILYNSLFRSLQMAYSACKMPTDNFSSFYDYGTKIGLWISAFEILFHPGANSHVGYQQIVAELSQYQFYDKKLNDSVYLIDKKTKTNIIGKVYKDIYDARNEFFHGNPVNKNNLFTFDNKKSPALTKAAPVVFFIALQIFLQKNNLLKKKIHNNFSNALFSDFKRNHIEDIFIKFNKILKAT